MDAQELARQRLQKGPDGGCGQQQAAHHGAAGAQGVTTACLRLQQPHGRPQTREGGIQEGGFRKPRRPGPGNAQHQSQRKMAAGCFGPIQNERQERYRQHGPMREPGEGAVQREHGRADDGRGQAKTQAPEQRERKTACQRHENDAQPEQPLRERQQEHEGQEESRGLTLGGQGQAQARIGVPPGQTPGEPVTRHEAAEGLGRYPGIAIDPGCAGQHAVRGPGALGQSRYDV